MNPFRKRGIDPSWVLISVFIAVWLVYVGAVVWLVVYLVWHFGDLISAAAAWLRGRA